ncbi:GlsB/YeaQ/YmgE family stress response membrane protein [Chlorobium sp. BLA1]|uniref:GlsB/YeaQ/YmgE family stress response membrane protein n=1 Tax=Candidatus Chlorobium masyuteum TaxID=2716876 RepID=UPI0014228480|nr:GlsB/YeaQ/YmgE family stress response membrane protein [Candidatus Chlorobium masyuteum]NHQ60190.1 GlsB/YeaQ/YmgE family stress response membrane protein [Candidatus Chlorobium masyuteum]NTU44547.1 GlsB/YeaQ/YmgE family stress response membrane protein [Chlorobiaceae bacterium]
MSITGLLIFILIGALAGWLAGLIVKGYGFGLLGDIVIGIIGAILGGYLFGLLGISLGGGILGTIVSATIGAVLLLFLIRFFRRV